MSSIFSRILKREIPGRFVWEDSTCFAIMTLEPIRPGHLLVIPREEIDHWDDVPDETAAHLMQVARIITKAIKQAVPCRRVGLSIVGLEVPHTHIHLIPIDEMADMNFARARALPQEELAQMAATLRSILREQGHDSADISD